MTYGKAEHEETANRLTERILESIPGHPEILDMDNPWLLYKVKDFQCNDINPTHAQAVAALASAQDIWRRRT